MSVVPLFIRHFDIFTYKNKSGTTDTAQVPTAATVTICRQGATSLTTHTFLFTVTTPYTISVDDTGDIQAGDTVQVGGNTALFLTVDSVPSSTQLSLVNDVDTVNVTVTSGDRLVPTNNLPTIYSDPLGTTSVSNPLTSDANTGRAQAYVRNLRFDYTVTGTISPGRAFANVEGGVVPQDKVLNALWFSSIQAAVDALPPDGGTVFIPASATPYAYNTSPSYTPPLNLPYNKAIRLLGEGPFRTYLQAQSSDKDTNMINMGGDNHTIEGIHLLGPGAAGSGYGIHIWRTGDYPIPHQADTATNIIYRAEVRNCRIQDTANYGLYIDDAVRNSLPEFSVWGFFDNLEVRNQRSGGTAYVGAITTTQFFKNCNFKQGSGYGARLNSCSGVSFVDCIFEALGDGTVPYVSIENSQNSLFEHCWFEGAGTQRFISTSGSGVLGLTVDTCIFNRTGSQSNPKAILIGTGARAVAIRDARLYVGTPVSGDDHIEIESDVEAVVQGGILTSVEFVSGSYVTVASSPRIKDTVGAGGDKATMLINAMTRMRLPRLTNDQRDALASVATADLLFNVTRDQIHARMSTGDWRALLSESYVRLPNCTTSTRPTVTMYDFGLMYYDVTVDRIIYVDDAGHWQKLAIEP